MKKIISLVLAAAMTMSMAVTAFAKQSDITKDPYVNDSSKVYVFDKDKKAYVVADSSTQEYSTKFAVEIQYNGDTKSEAYSKAMNRQRAFFEIKEGADIIKNIAISNIKYDNGTRVVGAGKPIAKNSTICYAEMEKDTVLPGVLNNYVRRNAQGFSVAVAYNGESLGKKGADWDQAKADALIAKIQEKNADGTYKNIGGDVLDANFVFGMVLVNKKGEFRPMPSVEEVYANEKKATDADKAAYEKKLQTIAAKASVNAVNKRKVPGKNTYEYIPCVTAELVDSLAKDNKDVTGFITVAKNNSDVKDNINNEKTRKFINFRTIINPDRVTCDGVEEEFMFTIDVKNDKGKFEPVEKASYIVDTKDVEWFDGKFDCTPNYKVLGMTKTGNFDFFNWPAKPNFKERGTLTFYTEIQNPRVYVINDNGTLREIHCEWEEGSEEVRIRTSGLRNYVITDVDLANVNK